MFSAIRRNLSPPTFIALLALVFALTGGAFAATGRSGSAPAHATLTAGAAKAKAKAKAPAKGPAGPKGPAGAAGATGPAGPMGPAGATGPAGPAGAGTPGTPGANGTNGVNGTEGKEGARGLKGVEGEPWTPNNTLPSNATETGAWSIGPLPESSGVSVHEVVASFPVELKEALSLEHVHFINQAGEEETVAGTSPQTACKGNVEEPTAVPGNLCVYIQELNAAKVFFIFKLGAEEPGASKTGALGHFTTESGGEAKGRGTWAVTAE
jgi:hypothetical protein